MRPSPEAGHGPGGLGAPQDAPSRARAAFRRWEDDYRVFARRRGFQTFNDWPYHRRGFLECWAEPGFHRFWRVWNPGMAYFVDRLFLSLGGGRRWALPTVTSFVGCGLAHNLVVLPLLGWSFTVVTAFTCFGLLTVRAGSSLPCSDRSGGPSPSTWRSTSASS